MVDPATREVITDVARCSAIDMTLAIEAVERSFTAGRERPPARRGAILRSWASLLLGYSDQLAILVTGKRRISTYRGLHLWISREKEQFTSALWTNTYRYGAGRQPSTGRAAWNACGSKYPGPSSSHRCPRRDLFRACQIRVNRNNDGRQGAQHRGHGLCRPDRLGDFGQC